MKITASSIMVALTFILTANTARAEGEITPPEGSAANQVVEYYFKGASAGPVLLNTKLCQKIDFQKGPNQYECAEALPSPVKKGGSLAIVATFLVPMEATYEDVAVQFLHEGTVRSTKDLKLTSALRYRASASESLKKAGKWEIKILRGDKTIHTESVTVEE